MKIKNPHLLLNKYNEKFKGCIKSKKLLSETEITNKIGISKSLFEQRYLPKLRDLVLIVVIQKDQNLKIIKEYLKAKEIWKNVKSKYYFFTPKTARIGLVFKEIIKIFDKYLKDKEEILCELDNLMILLQKYELETAVASWSLGKDKDFKEDDTKETKNIQDNLSKEILGATQFAISNFLVNCFKENPIPSIPVIELRGKISMKTDKVLELLNQNLNIKQIFDIESKILNKNSE
jgi:hypothetical protein